MGPWLTFFGLWQPPVLAVKNEETEVLTCFSSIGNVVFPFFGQDMTIPRDVLLPLPDIGGFKL